MGVIPRPTGKTYDCTDCEWQGLLIQTDAGQCPECGADIELVEEDYDPEPESDDPIINANLDVEDGKSAR